MRDTTQCAFIMRRENAVRDLMQGSFNNEVEQCCETPKAGCIYDV